MYIKSGLIVDEVVGVLNFTQAAFLTFMSSQVKVMFTNSNLTESIIFSNA